MAISFTRTEHQIINEVFILCDELSILDEVKELIEMAKIKSYNLGIFLSVLKRSVNALHSIKFYLNNYTENLFWQDIKHRLTKKNIQNVN